MKKSGNVKDMQKKLTPEEFEWAKKNVLCCQGMYLFGKHHCVLSLYSGNLVIGDTIQQAVRLEMEKDGVVIELDDLDIEGV